ncbi:cell division protein FtsA [Borreliella afzelii]|uniref:Cell division protein FtsA n=2 Tax=Borreliella afzelii TaxID=29518 RepID=Q0SNL1_BORAP|nr:cell division protein FtsA [Borreliella afzelii]ABH01567.1 cell division protein [Borreliella afzelii PKo]AFU74589.1 cell division protein [Borreliella afzelii HLJ01]AJY72291.1 cell division protein FtsA [Borreliella afzelii K78]EEC20763.1 cell division protein FtsA [Borreliella afzelii ACA-1]AEL69528.1 cell division protein FtsA [Borreliella afzelii PKo]
MSRNLIVGLDVGTSKICTVVAEVNLNDQLEIVGIGTSISRGVRKGVLINIEAALDSISNSIEAAELISGCDITSLSVSMSGSSVEGTNSRGVVAINSRTREINEEDVERVIEAAKAIVIPMDREILHVIPQEFIVDGIPHIKNPIDMMGIRLEGEVHIITGSSSSSQNLVRCVNRAGFAVDEVVLGSLASSYATLSKEEREMGVLFIDMGKGTTDIILYIDGSPYYTGVIPIGVNRVTLDIAQVWKVPEDVAENIKITAGIAHPSILESQMETVIIPNLGTRPPQEKSRKELAVIINSRLREIFEMMRAEIFKRGLYNKINGGIVLTGGGALFPGISNLIEEVFNYPARIGLPMSINGVGEEYIDPKFSSALGLVLYKHEQQKFNKLKKVSSKVKRKNKISSKLKGWFLKEWF